MSKYVVTFKGISPKTYRQLASRLHLKYFEITKKSEIAGTGPKPGAHMFQIMQKNPKGECIIQAALLSKNKEEQRVNIQMFQTKGTKKTRIFNPGTFNLTKMMTKTKKTDLASFLSNLIVKLTFK